MAAVNMGSDDRLRVLSEILFDERLGYLESELGG